MFSDELDEMATALRANCQVDLGDQEVLKRNLEFMYHSAVASEPLLQLATDLTRSKTPFEAKLKAYYAEHLEEEHGHEVWMLEDMATEGMDPTKNREWIAAGMSGSMYYAIKHWHPVALLGYMFFIEGGPLSLEMIEKLEELHGVELMRTVRFHSTHDVDHHKDLVELINECPEEYRELVRESLVQTGTFYSVACSYMRGD